MYQSYQYHVEWQQSLVFASLSASQSCWLVEVPRRHGSLPQTCPHPPPPHPPPLSQDDTWPHPVFPCPPLTDISCPSPPWLGWPSPSSHMCDCPCASPPICMMAPPRSQLKHAAADMTSALPTFPVSNRLHVTLPTYLGLTAMGGIGAVRECSECAVQVGLGLGWGGRLHGPAEPSSHACLPAS